ncbi:MAG: phosphoadenosine phosphosulfate reductase family protein, partial [Planctomycetes bacterium]|nr:phosphoadenosine phosphosulfate reductase family protein [Planctomycetota bacterium]
MNQLDRLENKSIFLLREAYSQFKSLCMLWSIGKDSTVLLWLARKAFFGHVPFPLVHIDTTYKIPEMIAYRDRLALEFGIDMIVGTNTNALKNKQTYPDGNATRIQCCQS